MDKIGFSIIFGYRKGNSKALYYKKDIYPPTAHSDERNQKCYHPKNVDETTLHISLQFL